MDGYGKGGMTIGPPSAVRLQCRNTFFKQDILIYDHPSLTGLVPRIHGSLLVKDAGLLRGSIDTDKNEPSVTSVSDRQQCREIRVSVGKAKAKLSVETPAGFNSD